MKEFFIGLVLATGLVASAYAFECQQRQAVPTANFAPRLQIRFPKFDSFWREFDDIQHTLNQINEDFHNVWQPIEEPIRSQQRQCQGQNVPEAEYLEDVTKDSHPTQQDESNGATSQNSQNFQNPQTAQKVDDDWSDESELKRRQQWEKKLNEDIVKEQKRREEWLKEKERVNQEKEREMVLSQEKQQQEMIRKRQEEILRRQEEIQKKKQEMEERLQRAQWLEEKRREEQMRQTEEQARRVQQERRTKQEREREEFQRKRERQEQIEREQWLQQKKIEEQQRQREELRRKEEQRQREEQRKEQQRAAEERLRKIEERQQAKQKELDEKLQQLQQQQQQQQERQQEELRRKRQQQFEQQRNNKNTESFQQPQQSQCGRFSECQQGQQNQNGRFNHQLNEVKVYELSLPGYYPADVSVRVRDGVLQIEGSHVCGCDEDCFIREFERKTTIPSSIDTKSISASLDSEGHFKVTGVQYNHPVSQNDTDIPVTAIHMPHTMPQTLKYCPEKKPTYKLQRIDPSTGNSHKKNAYKFERRKTSFEDDGVTIEVAEDFQ